MLEELKSYINDSSTSLGITDPALHINPLGVIDYIADEFFY